jgi:excisionase family DNA binding protein
MYNTLAYSIAEACARSGIGRTKIYELINTGQLPARKSGRHTLILVSDLQRCLQKLPQIKAKQCSVTECEDTKGGASKTADVEEKKGPDHG